MSFDPEFNIAYPAVRQTENWTCSACSWAWLAGSIGDPYTEWQAVQEIGMPENINPRVGLTNGSGVALANAYAASPRGWPSHYANVTWAAARELAAQGPLLLGGHGFNHWVAARGNAGSVLWLANPAPNWMGCGDSLDANEWNLFGPWSAVWLAA